MHHCHLRWRGVVRGGGGRGSCTFSLTLPPARSWWAIDYRLHGMMFGVVISKAGGSIPVFLMIFSVVLWSLWRRNYFQDLEPWLVILAPALYGPGTELFIICILNYILLIFYIYKSNWMGWSWNQNKDFVMHFFIQMREKKICFVLNSVNDRRILSIIILMGSACNFCV